MGPKKYMPRNLIYPPIISTYSLGSYFKKAKNRIFGTARNRRVFPSRNMASRHSFDIYKRHAKVQRNHLNLTTATMQGPLSVSASKFIKQGSQEQEIQPGVYGMASYPFDKNLLEPLAPSYHLAR